MTDTKQIRQPITPTHVIGSEGIDPESNLGYFSIDPLISDSLVLSVKEDTAVATSFFFDTVISADIDFDGAWRIISDQTGILSLDIQVVDWGQEPGPANSILDGNFITLQNADSASGDMSNWTATGLNKTQIVRVVVENSDNIIEGFTLMIDVKKRF